jgi:hypothetical protein
MPLQTTFLFAIILFSLTVYSQDSVKVKQIDSLVNLINNSNFKIEKDSIIQDRPAIGLSMRSYLTMVTNGAELKKYVNNVHATMQEKGVAKKMIGANTFYFDHNKLIKVDEFVIEGDKKAETFWYYYANDKPIYYTLKSDKAQERAENLLTIAKAMLDKMKFK